MKPKELTKARVRLGLSPVEMSRAMGIPYDTFNGWESGRRSMPAVAIRCVELLELLPAKTVQRLAARSTD
jgi:DNA-binding transcriptional regulator YiaG